MASEAPRSAGQGRQGRQPKTEGAASSLGTRQDKTRQDNTARKSRTTRNADGRIPHAGQDVAGRMDCGREWRTGCLGREQQEGNWLRREGRASPGAAQHGQVVRRRAS